MANFIIIRQDLSPPVPPTPPPVLPLSGAVTNSPNTLGCKTHTAYIQSKCNGPRLCELPDASAISYDRRLDDISEASVEIPISGDVDDPCCSCLGDVEPWCHQLTIVREGDGVVWTGPVVKVTYGYNSVKIEAKDKLAWLSRRVNPFGMTNPAVKFNTLIPLTKIAIDYIINPAMLQPPDDIDSPCFLDCIVDLGDGLPTTDNQRGRTFLAFDEASAYDQLLKLSNTAFYFTVIAQCLVLGPFGLPDIAIGTLTDEYIMGDINVIKDATNQANHFYIRYDGDDDPVKCAAAGAIVSPCPYTIKGDMECYGRTERLFNSIPFPNSFAAAGAAKNLLNANRLVPRLIEFPSSTKLSPNTPWNLAAMIPGQRIDVAITKLCIDVFQSFKLQQVTVDDGPEGESISISLTAQQASGTL